LRVEDDARRTLMNLIINHLRRLTGNDEGQDLLEYALLVALIALVAVVAVAYAGTQVNTIFKNIGAQLAAAV
jgi:pilus assembly protein Flp/PilA